MSRVKVRCARSLALLMLFGLVAALAGCNQDTGKKVLKIGVVGTGVRYCGPTGPGTA